MSTRIEQLAPQHIEETHESTRLTSEYLNIDCNHQLSQITQEEGDEEQESHRWPDQLDAPRGMISPPEDNAYCDVGDFGRNREPRKLYKKKVMRKSKLNQRGDKVRRRKHANSRDKMRKRNNHSTLDQIEPADYEPCSSANRIQEENN